MILKSSIVEVSKEKKKNKEKNIINSWQQFILNTIIN